MVQVKLTELSEMTDSRELLEAKTHPFISGFLLFLLVLLGAAAIWSYYGEIDITSKAAAIVRPNEKVSTVQTASMGKVTAVKVREGMTVQKGTELIAMDTKDLDLQLASQTGLLEKSNRRLSLLKRYRNSVASLHNEFSKTLPDEVVYYDEVEQFLLENQRLQQSQSASSQEIASAIHDNMGSQALLKNDLEVNQSKLTEQQVDLKRKLGLLQTELEQEKLLQYSVAENRSMPASADSKHSQQYAAYETKYGQLKKVAEEKEADYHSLQELGDRLVSQVELENAWREAGTSAAQVEQFREETLSGIAANVSDASNQLKELHTDLETLIRQASARYSEAEGTRLQQDKLIQELEDLENSKELGRSVEQTALNKLKADRIVQIGSSIEEEQANSKLLQNNIQQLKLEKSNRILFAPIDGTLNILKEVNVGDVIQTGEALLAIIPANESMYKMSLAVPNSAAGQIKLGDKVHFNFAAFPKQSYGSLNGTVTSIASDSVVQQDGRSYYLVEAALSGKSLVDRRGEQGEIRLGMSAEAYIITDSKRILDFVLEKINLKE
ncbi:hypothetical protein BSK49_07565 [Paenibacillus odorifer]|uniref:AprE-like beta-barrel domain-containing protein n=1 Tax=Paenibacillus odorifer TaxID=189426 RepID=A0ABX3GJG5_9BACL|nr:HlyD family efflux transporter periplasmic adaptor subunit [Paenibacillus odorifer]OMD20600.1 hypothetical protein BSO21_24355 [Paenibacillus odorifer]OMD91180.1 hypothetical protein BSK49_07565 [Paenibacillus odorifer]